MTNDAHTPLPESLTHIPQKEGYLLDDNGMNQQKILFPGWDTNSVRPDFGATDITISRIEGPGDVYMFNTAPTGGIVPAFTSGKYRVEANSTIRQENPAHAHTNWFFTKPGVYTMTVHATSTPTAGGAATKSNTATYTWLVGNDTKITDKKQPEPPAQNEMPGNGGSEPPASHETPGNGGSEPPAQNETHGHSAASTPVAKCFPKKVGGKGEDTLIPQIKDDRKAPASWVDPKALSFAIGNAGKTTAPSAIGSIPANAPVWMISATQVKGVPWVGANTMSPSLLEKTTGPTTFALTSFSGPGTMEVFTNGQFGTLVGKKWFTGQGTSASGSVTLDPNSHVHPNWVFSKPGTYKVGITMTTTAKDGKKLTGTTVLTFNVDSTKGANDGHFDLGPTIGAAGSKTVWLDANGNPCTPTDVDLAAAGLAKTGIESLAAMGIVATLFTGLGLMAVMTRRTRNTADKVA